ncbi:Autophagy protein 5 [Aphelenchoides besseyi]|nr:Autophagy protein 5 [Aphelenchoides besseyi]
MSVKKLAFVTNDRWVWTHEKPDIELLEPKSLNVTVDKRVLVFANQLERPQQTHKLTITNNGDRPVAFKTDGIITGRYLNAMPYTCSKNFFELLVSRRPSNYFKTTKYYKKVDVCNKWNEEHNRLVAGISLVATYGLFYGRFVQQTSGKRAMSRSKKVNSKVEDVKMDEDNNKEIDEDESDDEGSSDDELVEDDKIAEMEKLNFDFEALPPDSEDIFLRTDIKFEEFAKAIVDQSPAGCVFKSTEEYADEENEDAVYGTFGVGEFLLQRAKKYADKEVTTRLEKLLSNASESKVGFVVNERMLHFPAQIAGPTLGALKNDIANDNVLKTLKTFILILKVRFNETSSEASNSTNETSKPKGKAAKKRALADKLSNAEMIYDNEEEMLLFEKMNQFLFLSSLLFLTAFGSLDNWTSTKHRHVATSSHGHSPNVTVLLGDENPQARCYDSRLASYLNTGLSYYAHDMGSLSKYILDQIVRARMSGYWLVHSEMIQNRRQGLDPRILQCGHSVCGECATKLSDDTRDQGLDEFECPECRRRHPINIELPRDFRLKQIIEQMSDDVNNISVMNLQGEHSDSSIVPEKTKCRRCKIERDGGEIYGWICSVCVLKHHRMHDVRSLIDAFQLKTLETTADNKNLIEKISVNSEFYFNRYNIQKEQVVLIFNEMNTILNEADNLIFAMCMKILSNFQRHFRLPNESMEMFKHKITANETVDLHSLLSTSSGLLSDSNNQNYLAELETRCQNCSTPTLESTRDFVDTQNSSRAQSNSNATICTDEPKNRSNMVDDYEIRRNLWESGIAVEFRLDNADNVFHTAMPYYTILPRREYFPLVLGKALQFFSNVLGEVENITDAWLEADGIPLKWHHPVGVLFDLHSGAENLPWTVIVKFMGSSRQSSSSTKEFPAEVIRGSREAMKNCFFQTIKEADQLKHKGHAFDAMDSVEHGKLFDSICNGKFDDFWSVNSKLMALDGEGKFGNIPLRFHELGKPFRQSLIKTTKEGEDGNEMLLKDAVKLVYQNEEICENSTFITHGVEIPLETPVVWLARNLSYPDNFLHFKSSFSRYVEYAETPFLRPSYFSVPYRITPQTTYQYMSNEMFAHLVREHVRHQQRIRLAHQQRQRQQLQQSNDPILRGVLHITELRQTPYRRYSHNATLAMTYEEKRRRWKEELKNKMRGQKTPPRQIGSGLNVVGTAGRYYITFNPYSNARLPSYVKLEDFEKTVKPDDLLSTVSTTTTSTTSTQPPPIVVTQETIAISNDIEQSLLRQPHPLLTTTRPLFTTTRLPPTTEQIIYPTAMQSTTTRRPPIQPTRSLFGSYEDVDEESSDEDEDFVWFKPTRQGTPSRSSNGPPTTTEDEPTSDPFRIIVHGDQ